MEYGQLVRIVQEQQNIINQLVKSDRYVFQRDLQLMKGRYIRFGEESDIFFGTTTGSKIGTSATEKLGFWGVTPIVQPTLPDAPSGGSTVDTEARTAINGIRNDLIAMGLGKSS